jgi:hypothetical protein
MMLNPGLLLPHSRVLTIGLDGFELSLADSEPRLDASVALPPLLAEDASLRLAGIL